MKSIHFSSNKENKDFANLKANLATKKGVDGDDIRNLVKNAFLHRTKFDAVQTW
jgi:TRAP-type uncharacterized transport system substrate-binding protein